MSISFYTVVNHQFVLITDTDKTDKAELIVLPFDQIDFLIQKLGWNPHIRNEINAARKDIKIDYFFDHYLCSLQIKKRNNLQIEEPIIILKNKTQCVIIYDPQHRAAFEYIAVINTMLAKMNVVHDAVSLIPYALIRYDLENDRALLGMLEDKILAIELSITSHPNTIQGEILELRKTLSLIKHHYIALIDLLDEVTDTSFDHFNQQTLHDYKRLVHKTNRLYSNILMLHEYITQVHDSYRAQIEINLNKIMKIFTIITAIFMPLTLIAGWYGMNFETMPEIGARYGYLYVITLSLLVLSTCLYYIKKKGFWD